MSVKDSEHVHTSQKLTLGQTHILDALNTIHTHESDIVGIVQIHDLVVKNSEHLHTTEVMNWQPGVPLRVAPIRVVRVSPRGECILEVLGDPRTYPVPSDNRVLERTSEGE